MNYLLLIIALFSTLHLSAQTPAKRGGAGLNSQSLGNAHFEIDEDSKTLIVITDEATNETIARLIEQIDTPIPHASIKVLFLEVTHSDGSDIGVEFNYEDTEDDGDSSIIGSVFGIATGITNGGSIGIIDGNLNADLKALAQTNKLEVLSRPSIMARSNEEATITIGEEVPFIRNSQVTDDGRIINSIEYEDVGIILTVTPVITEDGTVEMQLESEISTMTGETVDISDGVTAPTIAKRSATTKVVVPDGKTVVIGGLMGNETTDTIRKVPILGSIPLLGLLFQRRIKTKTKTELLIFLTPNVIKNSDMAAIHMENEEKNATNIRERFPNRSYYKYLGDRSETLEPPSTGVEEKDE